MKLSHCGNDQRWRHLVLRQLKHMKLSSTVNQNIHSLATNVGEIVKDTLNKVDVETQNWARVALCWIIHAFRPLTVWELSVVLMFDNFSLSEDGGGLCDGIVESLIANLDLVFEGIFTIEHSEVHWAHPAVRDFLLAAQGHSHHVWYDVKDVGHQIIAESCLLYLSLPKVRDFIMENYLQPLVDKAESTIQTSQNSLSEYAIKYWPEHYRIATVRLITPSERADRFLQNPEAVQCWSQAYWSLSNPVTRTDRSFISEFPVFAGLGLQDLVKKYIDLEDKTLQKSTDRALALTEAARNGHIDMVRQLLQCDGYTTGQVEDALLAGASCANETIMDDIVNYITQGFDNFEWPPEILFRAAQFEFQLLAKKLIDCGAPIDGAIEKIRSLQAMTPVYFAVRHEHTDTLKMLLDRKASATERSWRYMSPLHLAGIYGRPQASKLLLEAGADINSGNQFGCTLLYMACSYGNCEVVRSLIEAAWKILGMRTSTHHEKPRPKKDVFCDGCLSVCVSFWLFAILFLTLRHCRSFRQDG